MHLNQTSNVSGAEIDNHDEQIITYILLTIMLSFLSVVGILGNIPVLIVFCKRKDRKASNTFIKILAFLDLMVCVFVMPYSIVYEYHMVTSDFACRLFEFFIHFSVLASNITLVAIATERYIAVCQIGKKIGVKTINRGMFGILALSVVISAPSIGTFAVVSASEVEEIPCTYPHEKTSGSFCHFTYTVMGEKIVTAYQILQMSVFFVELIAIIVLYSIIYSVLWKKTQIRKALTRHRESCISTDRQMTIEENTLIPNKSNKEGVENEIYTEFNKTNYETSPVDKPINHINSTVGITRQNDQESSPIDPVVTSVNEKAESKVTFQNMSEINDARDVTAKDNSYKTENKTRQSVSFEAQDRVRPKRSYHRRTAKMLFLCTVIYFVTWMPFWIDIFGVTDSRLLRYVIFIGHATNPIVYGIVNKQVRSSFKRLFLDCLKSWWKVESLTDRPANTDNVSFSGTSV